MTAVRHRLDLRQGIVKCDRVLWHELLRTLRS
jgi:hypothetical protein